MSTASAPHEPPIPAIAVGAGVVGAVYEQRRPMLLDDYPSAAQALAWAVSRGVRSVAAVPLINANDNLGVLADARLQRHHYTSMELDILMLAGTLAIAPALAMGSLRRQVREQERRLQSTSTQPQGAWTQPPPRKIPPLTRRERQILPLLAGGRTNREIGLELELSTGTVRNLVGRLVMKLNARDRTNAVVRAIEHGLLE